MGLVDLILIDSSQETRILINWIQVNARKVLCNFCTMLMTTVQGGSITCQIW